MDLFNAPHTASYSGAATSNILSQRQSPWENRPAWAQPQTSWPFRVIDPQSHRIGGGETTQQQPAWAS